ncbi:MAG: hypothetical protein ACK6AT_14115, partial [Planctomycetota bacterium]
DRLFSKKTIFTVAPGMPPLCRAADSSSKKKKKRTINLPISFRFLSGLRLEGQVMFFDLSFFRRRVIS